MSPMMIFGLVILGLLFIATLFLLNKEKGEKREVSIATLSFDGLLIAIICIMSFVPQVGYITIMPGLSLTLVHIPVLLGAAIGGRKKGLLLGTVFGLTSLIQAVQNPFGFNALFILPYVSLPPRMLFGYLAGLFFELIAIKKSFLKSMIIKGFGGFIFTIVHTLLVFGDLYLFAFNDVNAIMTSEGVIGESLVLIYAVIIAIGAVGEAILACVVLPLLTSILEKSAPSYYKRISFTRK